MNVQAYLERINYHGSLKPDFATLSALHQAHLFTVPFENLDIHLKRPIKLDEASLFDKIVNRRRGGFCYELNGLFAVLLCEVGYQVTLLSAGVSNDIGGFGPDFDHLTLMVTLDNGHWLADVGFGGSFHFPLPLDENMSSADPFYRVTHEQDTLFLEGRTGQTGWQRQYRFTLAPRAMADYQPMCIYHQTSPETHFTKGRITVLMNSDGRMVLRDHNLATVVGEKRHEQTLANEDEYQAVLKEKFGIVL